MAEVPLSLFPFFSNWVSGGMALVEGGGTSSRTATSYMVVLTEAAGVGTGNSPKHITDRRK